MLQLQTDQLYLSRCIAGVMQKLIKFYKRPILVIDTMGYHKPFMELLSDGWDDMYLNALDSRGLDYDGVRDVVYTDEVIGRDVVHIEFKDVIQLIDDKSVVGDVRCAIISRL